MPALAAIAGIDAVIVALVALIFLYATFPLWRPIINAVLSNVPLVGWWFAQQTDALVWRIWNWVSGWTEQAVFTVVTLIQHAALIPLFLAADTLGTVNSIIGALVRLGFQWLPAFSIEIHGYTDRKVTDEHAWANATFAVFSAYIDKVIGDEHLWAMATFAAFSQVYNKAIADLTDFTKATFAAFSKYIDKVIGAEQLWAMATFAAFSQVYNTAIATLRADTLAGLAAERAREQADVAAVAGLAGRLADQAETRANGHSDALAASGAAALAVVGAAVTKLERSPCIQRCDVLGDLGNGLQDLADAGLLAALLGLAVEFERDGPGTARALWADLGAPLSELVTTTRELAGV